MGSSFKVTRLGLCALGERVKECELPSAPSGPPPKLSANLRKPEIVEEPFSQTLLKPGWVVVKVGCTLPNHRSKR